MDSNTHSLPLPEKAIRIFSICALVFFSIMSLFYATRLEIEYYDGLEYLNAARFIRQHGQNLYLYNLIRPPLLPLVYFCTVDEHAKTEAFGHYNPLRKPHVLSVILSIFLLYFLYWFFREIVGHSLSFFLTGLFSFNRIFIHYAPFVMADIPGTLFLMMGMLLFIRARKKESGTVSALSALCFALAALTKFFYLITIPILLAYALTLLFQKTISVKTKKQLFILPVLTAGLFYLFCFATMVFLFGKEMKFHAMLKDILFNQTKVNLASFCQEPIMEYVEALLQSSGIGVMLFALAGFFFFLFTTKIPGISFYTLWILTAATALLSAAHKEPRYIMPLLPAWYLFSGIGIREVGKWITHKGPGPRIKRYAAPVITSMVILFSLPPAYKEHQQFNDPIYYKPFIRTTARTISQLVSPEQKIFWYPSDAYYSLYPQSCRFIQGDDFFYFFHMGYPVLPFYTGRSLIPIFKNSIAAQSQNTFLTLLNKMKTGDWVMITPEEVVYYSDFPPPFKKPLILAQLKRDEYELKTDAIKTKHSGSQAEYHCGHKTILFQIPDETGEIRFVSDHPAEGILFMNEGGSVKRISDFIVAKPNEEITLPIDKRIKILPSRLDLYYFLIREFPCPC
ncbi:MAG: glycosyltransferase family 39 protein [Candidatus Aureabacteria bacterium]|nr:glycosyltransferase family 39 protein [Candidatus Auribacterota bacterium]